MAAMVVIRCPETDREVQTGIVTDLVRFGRLGSGQAVIDCLTATNGTRGPRPTPTCHS